MAKTYKAKNWWRAIALSRYSRTDELGCKGSSKRYFLMMLGGTPNGETHSTMG